MGTWGYGLRSDDFVSDVLGVFEDLLKSGHSIADASNAVRAKFRSSLEDFDEGLQFWLALADMQRTYGRVDADVLTRVKSDLATGRGLERWQDRPKDLAKRKKVLEALVHKIETPNPRPKRIPKVVVRPPKFQPGDCLSICLSNGQYGAALVLATDHSNPEYGKDLVGVLDYLATDKPALDVFEGRKWFYRNHHHWKNNRDLGWYLSGGFRTIKNSIEVVGHIDILESDTTECSCYCYWGHLGEQVVLQHEWDRQQECNGQV
jgi:hypothetical protein